MHYKYRKVVTDGPNGKVIRHKDEENNPIFVLGDIEDYTYIFANNLAGQPEELEFIQVVLNDVELSQLKSQRHISQAKLNARAKIRGIKDFEDDLTDLKKTVQFMARGFAGLWQSLPQEMKDVNPYKENFDLFTQAITDVDVRLDLETDQVAKISKILQDEARFAEIVNEEYLGRL